jgi:fatty-acyl-CoA synthase
LDAANIELAAKATSSGWELSGEKTSISLTQDADHALVFARTGGPGARGVSAFFVSLDDPRVTRLRLDDVANRAAGRCSLFFDALPASPERMVGGEGQGFISVMQGFEYSRAIIGLLALGTAAAAISYARTRVTFGAPGALAQGPRPGPYGGGEHGQVVGAGGASLHEPSRPPRRCRAPVAGEKESALMSTAATAPLTRSRWPADTTAELFHGTVGDLLSGVADSVPERLALIEGAANTAGRRTWTYAQFAQAARDAAQALLRYFEPGTRIAVWAPNSPEWLILQQASALAGLVLVTINPAYRTAELEHVLRDSGARGLFHADAHRGFDMTAAARQARSRITGLDQVWPLSGWAEFAASGDPATTLPEVGPADIAMVQYTSGTTGSPKGVLIRHSAMVNSARFVAQRSGTQAGCVWLNPMPTFHIGSCGTITLGTISKQGTQIIASGFEPGLALELLESYRATIMLGVPTMLISMLEHPDLRTRDLSALRTVMTGGALVPAELVRQVKSQLNCAFTITFGQTETGGPSTQTDPAGSVWEQVETIGRALPHTELKIVDPSTGEIVPVGAQGEICTRGPMTMAGYLTASGDSGLRDGGWLHYGDLGSIDADGYVRITGRLKDMIIRGGENISPREIEEVLFQHPLVADAAVVGLPDPKWGERVAAVIRVADPGRPPVQEELDAHCRTRLSRHKVPVTWSFVTEFPLTPSGKVQKFKLRESLGGPR